VDRVIFRFYTYVRLERSFLNQQLFEKDLTDCPLCAYEWGIRIARSLLKCPTILTNRDNKHYYTDTLITFLILFLTLDYICMEMKVSLICSKIYLKNLTL